MKGYLVTLGIATIAISIIGGGLYLSSSYDEYQSRLHTLGVGPDAPIMMYDVAKWQFAKILGGGFISGGWIFGSILMGLGWIGKTLEEIRKTMGNEFADSPSVEQPRISSDSGN
ncbi:MAG TPA: hypothetical protein VF749_07450 [Candidatus Acidoferrum sp.]